MPPREHALETPIQPPAPAAPAAPLPTPIQPPPAPTTVVDPGSAAKTALATPISPPAAKVRKPLPTPLKPNRPPRTGTYEPSGPLDFRKGPVAQAAEKEAKATYSAHDITSPKSVADFTGALGAEGKEAWQGFKHGLGEGWRAVKAVPDLARDVAGAAAKPLGRALRNVIGTPNGAAALQKDAGFENHPEAQQAKQLNQTLGDNAIPQLQQALAAIPEGAPNADEARRHLTAVLEHMAPDGPGLHDARRHLEAGGNVTSVSPSGNRTPLQAIRPDGSVVDRNHKLIGISPSASFDLHPHPKSIAREMSLGIDEATADLAKGSPIVAVGPDGKPVAITAIDKLGNGTTSDGQHINLTGRGRKKYTLQAGSKEAATNAAVDAGSTFLNVRKAIVDNSGDAAKAVGQVTDRIKEALGSGGSAIVHDRSEKIPVSEKDGILVGPDGKPITLNPSARVELKPKEAKPAEAVGGDDIKPNLDEAPKKSPLEGLTDEQIAGGQAHKHGSAEAALTAMQDKLKESPNLSSEQRKRIYRVMGALEDIHNRTTGNVVGKAASRQANEATQKLYKNWGSPDKPVNPADDYVIAAEQASASAAKSAERGDDHDSARQHEEAARNLMGAARRFEALTHDPYLPTPDDWTKNAHTSTAGMFRDAAAEQMKAARLLHDEIGDVDPRMARRPLSEMAAEATGKTKWPSGAFATGARAPHAAVDAIREEDPLKAARLHGEAAELHQGEADRLEPLVKEGGAWGENNAKDLANHRAAAEAHRTAMRSLNDPDDIRPTAAIGTPAQAAPAPVPQTEHHDKIRAKLTAGLASSGLPEAQHKTHAEAIDKALGSMSPEFARMASEGVKSVRWHPDTKALGEHLAETSPNIREAVDNGGEVGGGYNKRTGELHADGPMLRSGQSVEEILTHELGHAAWKRMPKIAHEFEPLWQAEIKDGKHEYRYAKKNPEEGFCEALRIASRIGPEKFKEDFPQVGSLLDRHGLLHDVAKTAPAVEIFDKPLYDGPQRADTLLKPEAKGEPFPSSLAPNMGEPPPDAATTPLPTPLAPAEANGVPAPEPIPGHPMHDTVTHVRPLGGGATGTHLATMANGKKGVWKPANGQPSLREDVPANTYHHRETAASDVAKVLGLDDLVPSTVTRSIDGPEPKGAHFGGQPGSLQEFHGKTTPAKLLTNPFDGEKDHLRSAAFDYIMGQTDRHPNNWLLTDKPDGGIVDRLKKRTNEAGTKAMDALHVATNGKWSKEFSGFDRQGDKLKLIDNALSLPTKERGYHMQSSDFLRAADRHKVPDLGWAGKWPEIEAKLKANHIEEPAIALAKQRYDAVVKAGAEGSTFGELPFAGSTTREHLQAFPVTKNRRPQRWRAALSAAQPYVDPTAATVPILGKKTPQAEATPDAPTKQREDDIAPMLDEGTGKPVASRDNKPFDYGKADVPGYADRLSKDIGRGKAVEFVREHLARLKYGVEHQHDPAAATASKDFYGKTLHHLLGLHEDAATGADFHPISPRKVNIMGEEHYDDNSPVHRMLKNTPDEHLAALASATHGAELTKVYRPSGWGTLHTLGNGAHSYRTFEPGETPFWQRVMGNAPSNEIKLMNGSFGIDDDSPLKGHGYKVFANQVAAARAAGIKNLSTLAAGPGYGAEYNGHYTWPRLGYEGEMHSNQFRNLPADVRTAMGKSRSLRKLFDDVPGGKEAWGKMKIGTVPMHFATHPTSVNSKALEKYAKERDEESRNERR